MQNTHSPITNEITAERERLAWSYRLRSWSQEKIAIELGISQPAVCKMLKKMTKRYYNENMRSITEVKRQQVAQLEQAAQNLYQAWEQSKELEKKRQINLESSGGGFEGGDIVAETIIKDADPVGDVRFLAEYRKFKEDIRKILGLDAPVKTDNKNHNIEEVIEIELDIQNANKRHEEKLAELELKDKNDGGTEAKV